ncbi:MAG: acylphosphatase [Dehalococcoidia bacterium]|nr:acylphosphatase [Dehalococcoidia bacterium]
MASSLSLVGSCRQLPDGACEAIVQGEKTLLKRFVVACKRRPPRAPSSNASNVGRSPSTRSLGDFHIER